MDKDVITHFKEVGEHPERLRKLITRYALTHDYSVFVREGDDQFQIVLTEKMRKGVRTHTITIETKGTVSISTTGIMVTIISGLLTRNGIPFWT